MQADYNTRETLLMKLKDGNDEEAWREFDKIYKGFIWSIIIKMGVPQGDQADLVQDVLLKAWKSLPSFEYNKSRGKFRSWLSLVTSNTARTYYRGHNKKLKLFSDEDSDQKIDAEIERICEEEWKKFVADMAWKKVSQTLSEQLKNCFELLSQGVEIKEVASQLDMPYNTAVVYRRRVINKIAKEIAEIELQLG